MKQKVLITGGAGFIGAHVAQALLQRGDDVVLMDDFNNRYTPVLKEARVEHLLKDFPSQPMIRGDIRNKDLVFEAFEKYKPSKVIHLAAWASVQPSIDNPHVYSEVNVDGTVNIFEVARKNDVESIVFASSSSVYGGQKEVPFKETANVSRTISPYAATKAAGEIMAATWNSMYDIPISCMRFFTVYGAWGRPEMALFQFAERIYKGEPVLMRGATTQRDFTYIDDIVQGVIGALDNPHGFAIYNLGNHDAVLLPRFIAAIETTMGKKAEIQEVPLPMGDIPATLADITKATNELNYHPTTSIEQGVANFMPWFLEWYVPRFVK